MKSFKENIKTVYKKIFPDFYFHFKRELADCDSILDLGCGPDSPVKNIPASRKVGVELFDAYLEESKAKNIHHEYIKEDVTKVYFPDKSFDAIVMVDVLEHLSKEEANELFLKMDGWARKKIVILTPNGFIHQHDVDHNHLQEHKSGWSEKEFIQRGYKVRGMNGLKYLRGEQAALKFKPVYLWILISALTQELVYYVPSLAYHLYAVKEPR